MESTWKYPLVIPNKQAGALSVKIPMPVGSQILTVQEQCGHPCMWIRCDTSMPKVDRQFDLIGTGIEVEEIKGEYVSTVQTDHGQLVWHIFEREVA